MTHGKLVYSRSSLFWLMSGQFNSIQSYSFFLLCEAYCRSIWMSTTQIWQSQLVLKSVRKRINNVSQFWRSSIFKVHRLNFSVEKKGKNTFSFWLGRLCDTGSAENPAQNQEDRWWDYCHKCFGGPLYVLEINAWGKREWTFNTRRKGSNLTDCRLRKTINFWFANRLCVLPPEF